MTEFMRWQWLVLGLAAIAVLFLAYAWYDGGREPLRPIAQTVPVPELAR